MKVTLYHVSKNDCVKYADITKANPNSDYGMAFYMFASIEEANSWAYSFDAAFINVFELEMDGLSSKEMSISKSWIEFICNNRQRITGVGFDESVTDVVIGPSISPMLSAVIDQYDNGLLDWKTAIEITQRLNPGVQYAITSFEGLNKLAFITSIRVEKEEKEIQQQTEKLCKEKFIVETILRQKSGRSQKRKSSNLRMSFYQLQLAEKVGGILELVVKEGYDEVDVAKEWIRSSITRDIELQRKNIISQGKRYIFNVFLEDMKDMERTNQGDSNAAFWFGYLVTYWWFTKGISADEIGRKYDIERILLGYDVWHTLSIRQAIEKIEQDCRC